MADTKLNIWLRLRDQVSAQVGKVRASIQSLEKSLLDAGHKLRETGRNMVFLGTAITGPLALAYKSAANYSLEISATIIRLQNSLVSLRNTIAKDLQPVAERLADWLNRLTRAFKELDPELRGSLIRFAAWVGIGLIAGGIIVNIAGRILMLASGLLALSRAAIEAATAIGGVFSKALASIGMSGGSLLAIVGAIVVIIGSIYALRAAWIQNFSGMRDCLTWLGREVKRIWDWIINNVFSPAYKWIAENWAKIWTDLIKTFVEFAENISGAWYAMIAFIKGKNVAEAFVEGTEKLKALREILSKYVAEPIKDVTLEAGEAFKWVGEEELDFYKDYGHVIVAQMKKDLEAVKALFADLKISAGEAFENMFPGLSKGIEAIEQLIKKLKEAKDEASNPEEWEIAKEIARNTALAMHRSFSDIFFDGIVNGFKNLRQIVQSFAQSIIRIMIEAWTRLTLFKLFTSLGGLPGGAGNFFMEMSNAIEATAPKATAIKAHTGGIAGVTSFPKVQVPAFAFASAPRLHDYIGPAEVPAILRRGEPVGYPNVNVNIMNRTGVPLAAEARSRLDMSGMIIDIVVDNVARHGRIYQTIQSVAR